MKILGIESSSLVASVAVIDEQMVLAEYTVNYRKTHSQTLLPMLDEILRMIEMKAADADAIACAAGPGSFTGLRIGAATAKGLGLAAEKPLIAVPTLDAMAYGLYGCRSLICPMLDARRGQVYAGLYTFDENGRFTVLRSAEAADAAGILAQIRKTGRRAVFLGDGVPAAREIIRRELGGAALFAPPSCSRQRAASVAALGLEMFRRGETTDAADFAPLYCRVSQAERERKARMERERSAREARPGTAEKADG